jgi:hypothetical protein
VEWKERTERTELMLQRAVVDDEERKYVTNDDLTTSCSVLPLNNSRSLAYGAELQTTESSMTEDRELESTTGC